MEILQNHSEMKKDPVVGSNAPPLAIITVMDPARHCYIVGRVVVR